MEIIKNKRRKRLKRIGLLSLLIILVLLYYPALVWFSGYLSITEKVKANTLLVEGWLEEASLKQVVDEFRSNNYDYIITTGNILPDQYELYENGFLIFNLTNIDTAEHQKETHFLSVEAHSSLRGKEAAHFNFWVNDSLIRGFLTAKRSRQYEISWYGALSELDSILIQYDNDKANYGDRNLFITGLQIDQKYYKPYTLKADYDLSHLDGKRREERTTNSFAGQARARLINLGIDPRKVISVPGYKTNISRTYSSALAFRNWLDRSPLKIRGINVISLGDHSRRTWLTYKKVLAASQHTGIIALPDPYHKLPDLSGILFVTKQAAAYIYYKFLLLPVKSLLEPRVPVRNRNEEDS